MSWEDRIRGCFGFKDKKFALHNTDRKHAQQVLSEALMDDVGHSEYLAAFRRWLENEGCNDQHVEEQMKRVALLSSYFTRD